MEKYLGIDIGGTNLKSGVIQADGTIIAKNSQPTSAKAGLEALLTEIRTSIKESINEFPDIKSIGIGVPGIVSEAGVVLISPNIPCLKDTPLKKILSREFHLPIAIDNDANAAAVAELAVGAGSDLTHFIYVTLGTGVGGAIIYDRKIFRGESGGAGEIGHTIINFDDVKENIDDYRIGTLEENIGRKQIIVLAERILENYNESILCDDKEPDIHKISEACFKNDAAAIEIFTRVGELLGIGLASIMNLLDISTVIIGGGISQAHPILFETALATIKKRALPTIAAKAEIRKALFSKDAGIIGAALIAKPLIPKT